MPCHATARARSDAWAVCFSCAVVIHYSNLLMGLSSSPSLHPTHTHRPTTSYYKPQAQAPAHQEPPAMLRNVGKRLLGGVTQAQRVRTARDNSVARMWCDSSTSSAKIPRRPHLPLPTGPASLFSIRFRLPSTPTHSLYSSIIPPPLSNTTARPPRLPLPSRRHLGRPCPGQSLLHPQRQVHDHRPRIRRCRRRCRWCGFARRHGCC